MPTRRQIKTAQEYLDLITAPQQDEFAIKTQKQRAKAIEQWYSEGGDYFLQWVDSNYRTHDRSKLDLSEKWYRDFLRAFGHPLIERIITQKGAQVGYTEAAIAYTGFCLAELRIPVAYGVERQMKLRDIVGPRVQPSFKTNEQMQRLSEEYASIQQDIDTKTRNITIGGIPVTFFYATVAGSSTQTREASSSLSTFTAWSVVADEIELIPRKALEVIPGRMEASPLPTRPVRFGSTPGRSGGTVDTLIKESGILFKWHITCPHCGAVQELNPRGNLLKEVEIEIQGRKESRYTDLLGRPLDWFCHDRSSLETKIATAYIGCRYCSQSLPTESLCCGEYGTSHYAECNTGFQSLNKFLDDLSTPITDYVGVLLPKLASPRFNPADKIRKLMKNENVAVVFQEELGCVSDNFGNCIPVDLILDCKDNTLPEWADIENTITVFGIDQGVEFNWLIACRYYFPDHPDTFEDWATAHCEAFCEVLHWGKVYRFGIQQRNTEPEYDLNYWIEQFEPYLIGFDLKPDTSSAMDFAHAYCPDTVLEPPYALAFMETELKDGKYQAKKKKIQGQEVQYFALHRTFGMDCVRDRILQGTAKLPEGMSYGTESDNLVYHLSTSERDSQTAKWDKPTLPDHGHHCWSFAESALYAYRFEDAYQPPAFISMDRLL